MIPNCPHCGKKLKRVSLHVLDFEAIRISWDDESNKLKAEVTSVDPIEVNSGPYCWGCNEDVEKFLVSHGLEIY